MANNVSIYFWCLYLFEIYQIFKMGFQVKWTIAMSQSASRRKRRYEKACEKKMEFKRKRLARTLESLHEQAMEDFEKELYGEQECPNCRLKGHDIAHYDPTGGFYVCKKTES